jgi:pimeloyl-ACP methyl ester carboxylesterase
MTALIWIVGVVVAALALLLAALAVFTAWTARRIVRELPPRGRFIDVDGARIHYFDEGAGQPLVLVHGLAGQTGNFTHSLLDRLKNDYRVIILDRPGSGHSTRPRRASAAIVDQAATISRFIAALGLDRPLLVGHSLGGAISLALAVNHPEQVGGLALIAPASEKPDVIPPVFRGIAIKSPFVRSLVAHTLIIPMSIKNRGYLLDLVFGPQPVPHDYATKGGGFLNLRPSSFITSSADLMAVHEQHEDMTAHYGKINMPVGILYGTHDRLLDPEVHGAGLADKIPGAEYELIEGGGHMIVICSADRCAEFIIRMAQRVAAERPSPLAEKELAKA